MMRQELGSSFDDDENDNEEEEDDEEDEEGFDTLPTWGAQTLSDALRRRLRTREPTTPVTQYNLLLLGPAGVGKSSLIHTSWRALSGNPLSDAKLIDQLRLGWSQNEATSSKGEKSGGLRAKHGTTVLTTYDLQPRSSQTRCSICAQDTKGQQFFDAEEAAFAHKAVKGHLRAGSSQEEVSLYYWTLVAKVGLGRFVKGAELETSPHVVVLVFDATLRSFRRMLESTGDSAQLDCYVSIATAAKEAGLAVFVALTHVDVLVGPSKQQQETRVGESIGGRVLELQTALSQRVGADLLPTSRIFAVENYRLHKNDRDDSIELATLEFLDALVHQADAYLTQQHAENHPRPSSSGTGPCSLS